MCAHLFGDGGKASDIGEEDGDVLDGATEEGFARFEEPFDDFFGHVTRHRGLEALFAGDIFDDEDGTDQLMAEVEEGCKLEVDGDGCLVGEDEVGIDGAFG